MHTDMEGETNDSIVDHKKLILFDDIKTELEDDRMETDLQMEANTLNTGKVTEPPRNVIKYEDEELHVGTSNQSSGPVHNTVGRKTVKIVSSKEKRQIQNQLSEKRRSKPGSYGKNTDLRNSDTSQDDTDDEQQYLQYTSALAFAATTNDEDAEDVKPTDQVMQRLRSESVESRSRSHSLSRSVTPDLSDIESSSGVRASTVEAKARRALIMSMVTNAAPSTSKSSLPTPPLPPQKQNVAKRDITPPTLPLPKRKKAAEKRSDLQRFSSIAEQRTPGGTLHVDGVVPTMRTTGGSKRRKLSLPGAVPLPSAPLLVMTDVARDEVEESGLGEEDLAYALATAPWQFRTAEWVDTVSACETEFPTTLPLQLSTAADEARPSTSGLASVPAHGQGASKAQSAMRVTTADSDIRLSTSGMRTRSGAATKQNQESGSELDSEHDNQFVPPIERNVMAGIERDIPDDEDLDEPIQDLINDVQRAMDDEVDSMLVGVSSSFDWVADFGSFRGKPEEFSGPTPGPIKEYHTPYDVFTDIWSEDIIARMVQETNRYAKQTIDRERDTNTVGASSRSHRWKETDADEMLTLLAVYMYMGIDPRTSVDEYWKTGNDLEMPRFRQLMSYNRYTLLNRFLHFTDNSDTSQDYLRYEGTKLSPKLTKLAPLISHLNIKFTSLYNLERDISIDESLTLFKGCLSWVQAIRTKAARFGIKSYELAESKSGYLYKFQIYTGKNSDDVGSGDVAPSADLGGKSTKVVLDLLKDLKGLGHCVTMDNFYNCPSLARYLKSLGFDCLGTLRPTRRNVPKDVANVSNKVEKGHIVARHSGDVSVLAWKDSKVVTMISTFHDDETYVGSKAGKPLVKPLVVRDYNNTMGGVYLKDQKLSMYLIERKRAVKWYAKIFKRLLNASILNAYIMFSRCQKARRGPVMTHREFRYDLAKTLRTRHGSGVIVLREPIPELIRLRRDILHESDHVPGQSNRKRCVVCWGHRIDKKVHSRCVTCGNVALCFGTCFRKYHTLAKLQTRSSIRGKSRNE